MSFIMSAIASDVPRNDDPARANMEQYLGGLLSLRSR